MTWNYRVAVETVRGTQRFTIVEVYYNDAGDVESWTESVAPCGDDWQDLADDLDNMRAALTLPVFELDVARTRER